MPEPTPNRVTAPPAAHFFGYYDKSPWDGSGRYLLAHAVDFEDRLPGVDDPARIKRFDVETGEAETIGRTTAWNFQQGSMLQWLPPDHEAVAFNDRQDGSFVTRVVDPEGGEERTLPRPLHSTTPDGRRGFSLNFARLRRTRPVCGYAVPDPDAGPSDPCPADDGVHRMDLDTGETALHLSLAEAAAVDPLPSMDGAVHRFNHLTVSPAGERLTVTHRWEPPGGPREDRLLAVDAGSVEVLAGTERVGHPTWRSESTVVAYTREDATGRGFHEYDLEAGTVEPFARTAFEGDSHLTFSPDGAWALGDTFPDGDRTRRIRLYGVEAERTLDLGGFHSPEPPAKTLRCDLHPRWDRAGSAVCFDSTHEGRRQVYTMDVGELV